MSLEKQLTLIAGRDDEGRVVLKSPAVGVWHAPRGQGLAAPGEDLGSLEVLGSFHRLVVPAGVRGYVESRPEALRHGGPVGFGDLLMTIGVELAGGAVAAAEEARQTTGLAFRSNSSGRFYSRPSPDKPAFVTEGEEVSAGQTVYLLEVMKTFSRVSYGGDDVPERARVTRIVPKDGDDLEAGQVVLELEAI